MSKGGSLIRKYAGYFHDGSIHGIQHENDAIILSIESAEVLPDWDWDRKNTPLSKRNTISGKLHLIEIKNIKENQKHFSKRLKMISDHCDLFEFKIMEKKISLLITWEQYSPIRKTSDMIHVEIEAEKIFWENIPTLFDNTA